MMVLWEELILTRGVRDDIWLFSHDPGLFLLIRWGLLVAHWGKLVVGDHVHLLGGGLVLNYADLFLLLLHVLNLLLMCCH
jgi:hypothetical protein